MAECQIKTFGNKSIVGYLHWNPFNNATRESFLQESISSEGGQLPVFIYFGSKNNDSFDLILQCKWFSWFDGKQLQYCIITPSSGHTQVNLSLVTDGEKGRERYQSLILNPKSSILNPQS